MTDTEAPAGPPGPARRSATPNLSGSPREILITGRRRSGSRIPRASSRLTKRRLHGIRVGPPRRRVPTRRNRLPRRTAAGRPTTKFPVPRRGRIASMTAGAAVRSHDPRRLATPMNSMSRSFVRLLSARTVRGGRRGVEPTRPSRRRPRAVVPRAKRRRLFPAMPPPRRGTPLPHEDGRIRLLALPRVVAPGRPAAARVRRPS